MKNQEKRTATASRRGRAAIATAVIAATVAGGLGLATSASAATTTASAATTTASAENVVDAWTTAIPPWSTLTIPRLICPAGTPYLVDGDFSPGRIVPRGVEVIERGYGAGVTSLKVYVAGTGDTARGLGLPASVTNWGFDWNNIAIKLHCTSDARQSYFVPPDSRDWGY